MAKQEIRILHTADLHIGTRFSSFPDREVRDVLRSEQSKILLELAEAVNREAIDLVLIAGDLFDRPDVEEQIVERVKNRLAELPCKVHICAGNHDPYLEGSFWEGQWPNNVHIVPQTEVESYYYEDLGILVDSISFADIYTRESLYRTPDSKDVPSDTLRLLMLHGDFNLELGTSDYNPIPLTSVKAKGYDYIALGHIHLAHSGELGYRDATYAYSGAPQGRGFDELGQGHFRIGRFVHDEAMNRYVQTWSKYILNTRPFFIRTIPISDAENEEEIQQAVEEALAKWEEELEVDLKRAILRLVFVGTPRLKFKIDLLHHQEVLKSLGYFYVEIRDETRAPIDLDRLSKLSGFGQVLVQQVAELKANANSDEERARVDRALDLLLRTHERSSNET